MTIDLDQLESAAKAATQGSWDYGACEVFLKGTDFWPVIATCRNEDNTAFIAEANPAVVLEMIAELRKARSERDWLAEMVIAVHETGYCPPHGECPIVNANPDHGDCVKCWLKAAREAVEEQKP